MSESPRADISAAAEHMGSSIRHEFLDFPLAEVTTLDWDPGRNLGHLTIGGADPVVVKAVDVDGGDYFNEKARAVIQPPTA